MKRTMYQRIISILIALMMLVSMTPEMGHASESMAPVNTVGNVKRELSEEVPAESHQWEVDQEDAVTPAYETEVPAEFISDLSELVPIIREAMWNFETDVQVYVRSPRYEEEPSLVLLYDMVFEHTGDHRGGDTFGDEYDFYVSKGDRIYDDNYLYRRYTIRTESVYTKEQAAELDAAIDQLVGSWDLEGLTEYERLRLVYDWMCSNIEYDHYHLENDPDYELMYTAYAAMIHRTCVCDGYANLFYRLALACGLDARKMIGTYDGGCHAWNIVRVDRRYYSVDATWDSTTYPHYMFFLRGQDFYDHGSYTLDEYYTSDEWRWQYRMASRDYDEELTRWPDYAVQDFIHGSGTQEDPYQIATAEELALLAFAVNGEFDGYADKHYVLTADIDLSGHQWEPIAVNSYDPYTRFTGVLDGNGHTISNMTITEDMEVYEYGLFGCLSGTVRDLVIQDAKISLESSVQGWVETVDKAAALHVGAVAGRVLGSAESTAVVQNCMVKDLEVDVTAIPYIRCGGITGVTECAQILTSGVNGHIQVRGPRALQVGGAIGVIGSESYISQCRYRGTVSAISDESLELNYMLPAEYTYFYHVGGFCGNAGQLVENVEITDCYVRGNVSLTAEGEQCHVGGFGGFLEIVYGKAIYKNLYCYGDVSLCTQNGEEPRPYFWMGEWGMNFYDQWNADQWEYTNCIRVDDQGLWVKNSNASSSFEDMYEWGTDLGDLFVGILGFDAQIWKITSDELPVLWYDDSSAGDDDLCRHIFEETVITEPECEWDGLALEICTLCGYEREKTLPATGHQPKVYGVTEPSCDGEGYSGDTRCEICDVTLAQGHLIPALGHAWEGWMMMTVPTATASGEIFRECAVCGCSDFYTMDPTAETVITEVMVEEDGTAAKVIVDLETEVCTTATVDEDGIITTWVGLSRKAVRDAERNGNVISLRMDALTAVTSRQDASMVILHLPGQAQNIEPPEIPIEIAVANTGNGVVALMVSQDGSEQIVKTTVATEAGIRAKVPADAVLKIVDNTKTFSDVLPSDWEYGAVSFAASRELFNGTGADTFSPDMTMTRGMIVTVLARLNGVDTTASEGQQWYEPGINWAISVGLSDGTNPENIVTREQLAVMLWRYVGSPYSDHSLDHFVDADQIHDWPGFVMAMSWANEVGVINGGGNGCLNPLGDAARGQVAQMLKNFIEKVDK